MPWAPSPTLREPLQMIAQQALRAARTDRGARVVRATACGHGGGAWNTCGDFSAHGHCAPTQSILNQQSGYERDHPGHHQQFVDATTNVLETMAMTEAKADSPFVKQNAVASRDITADRLFQPQGKEQGHHVPDLHLESASRRQQHALRGTDRTQRRRHGRRGRVDQHDLRQAGAGRDGDDLRGAIPSVIVRAHHPPCFHQRHSGHTPSDSARPAHGRGLFQLTLASAAGAINNLFLLSGKPRQGFLFSPMR